MRPEREAYYSLHLMQMLRKCRVLHVLFYTPLCRCVEHTDGFINSLCAIRLLLAQNIFLYLIKIAVPH
jgi:hypothetical protein